jgi:PAS domain S-box-containing protein
MVEDITERKKADEARFRHAAIVESSEDAIASATLDGTILSWNLGAQRIFEYTESEAIGKSVTLIVPPELADEESKILGTLRAGGCINQFETVRVTKTGKRINVSLTISPIKDSSGRTIAISGIARDITERKMAEHRLRDYEEAVEGAEDLIGIIDRQYRYLLVNRQYLKTHNLTREQVVGHFLTEVLNKEVFETAVKPKLDECFQGKAVRFEIKYSYPTVGERDLLVSYFPIQGVNGVDRAAAILHDITDRKRAEEALLEMNRTLEAQSSLLRSGQELLSVFVKNVPAAVAMLDRDMRYLQVSDRWCSDYLSGRAQVLGRSHYEIFPDLPERWKEVHRRALEGETLRVDEDRWDGQDGTHWARWEVRPWKSPEGTVGGILILAEDITRRKQMEEALSDMNRKLIESQEQERARIGRELHDDIAQRLALLAIEIDQVQECSEKPSKVRNRARELVQRTKEISSDIQSLSHELHSSAFELLGFEAGMRSWCREFAERQKLQIAFQSHNVPQLPREISLCLFRILQEALQNAAKHSGAKQIEVKLVEKSGEIHLTVSDSGKGFEVKAPGQSRGLGLTSMQERVRLVNGTIEIQSKPMSGTTILVRVPFKSEHSV